MTIKESNGNFIKKEALKDFTYQTKIIKVTVKDRHYSAETKQCAISQLKLPDFCTFREVTVEGLIKENPIGRHDLVFDRKYYKKNQAIVALQD